MTCRSSGVKSRALQGASVLVFNDRGQIAQVVDFSTPSQDVCSKLFADRRDGPTQSQQAAAAAAAQEAAEQQEALRRQESEWMSW